MRCRSRLVVVLFLLMLGLCEATRAADDKPKPFEFECRYASAPIVVDGKPDDADWQSAVVINKFDLPWLQEKNRPAKTATKARLLWDREYFYFFAEMQDSDLYADIKDHDGMTWFNDVFEIFLKPAEDKPGYYEFQVNAAGTVMDMFMPQRGSGGYLRYIKADEFHIDAKVATRGTLNQWTDRDDGWSVEGRIPWRDFIKTGGRPAIDEKWKFALCRYDYSVDIDGPELSSCAPLKSKTTADFHLHEDYATLRFIGPKDPPGRQTTDAKSDRLERLKAHFGKVPSRVTGSPEPPAPYQTARVLPNLKLTFPIVVANEPGTRRLIFVDQTAAYGASRLCITTNEPETGEHQELFKFDGGGMGYSIAFHPQFATNGYVYIGMNTKIGEGKKHTRVVRYTIGRQAPFEFDVKSAKEIIAWESDGHNGGAVAFGSDGMLYVTSGDGTSDSDTNLTGQGLNHLLAKLLRIDVDHPDAGKEYSVPKDNPFLNVKDARPETYALGFRNPWRLHIDTRKNHIWVGNNGQDLWEQVYLVERGANYGWSIYEGGQIFYANRTQAPVPISKPIFDHPHSDFRSLTGGTTYYGKKLPDLVGAYIYGDHSTGKIWAAKVEGRNIVWHRELVDTTMHITCFAIDGDGELLIADHRGNNEGGFYTLIPNSVDPAKPSTFPRLLSESGLFASVKEHRFHDGVLPYSVNAQLWSDGAHKERGMSVPATTKSAKGEEVPLLFDLHSTQSWKLPDQTVLVKSFALELEEGNAASRRWVETRFLTKQEDEWFGYSYHWNDEQTDAALVAASGTDRSFEIKTKDGKTRTHKWHYPSRAECMVCHSRAANFVLGPSPQQFNREHDYGGVVANQFDVLEWLGLVQLNWRNEFNSVVRKELEAKGLVKEAIDAQLAQLTATRNQRAIPPQPTKLLFHAASKMPAFADPYDKTKDVALRARSYLHANCAHCHVEAGGGNAQFDINFKTELAKTKLLDVAPLHHKFDLADPKLVAAGQPDRSILLTRLERRGPNSGQMPQLATDIVDQAAVELIREWITKLPNAPAKPQP